MDQRMAIWIAWMIGLSAVLYGTVWILDVTLGPGEPLIRSLFWVGGMLALGRGTFPSGRRE